MSQDATKVVLAATQSNHKDIDCFAVDPASFPAGLCVSLASTGLPSLLASAGMRIGVSKGKSLSDHKKTAVCRRGLRVPVQAALKRSTGLITISSYANLVSGTDDAITIGGQAFTAQAGAATPGDPTFQAATSNAATATSLAAQINAHTATAAKVYAIASSATVRLYAKVEGAATGHDVAVSYTDNDTNVGATLSELTGGKLAGGSDTISDADYIVAGAKMYINDTTGKADVAMTGFSTISDAVYCSTVKTGIMEDGTEVAAALVDMQGGL
jgi:hypothetical protein